LIQIVTSDPLRLVLHTVLNEFAMMWAVRDSFPLHYTVFKQYASHLPHEANVEQLFSRSGNLSDPNIDPDFLAALTSISVNKKVYKPAVSDIKDMFFKLYRGKAAEASAASDAAGSCASPKGSSSGAGPSCLDH
jgi:hypothetical protein